ncbi:Uncharacterised protein [Vibrio cholerae]|nr:Uncharacterised protein [Vibrio cholerae]
MRQFYKAKARVICRRRRIEGHFHSDWNRCELVARVVGYYC